MRTPFVVFAVVVAATLASFALAAQDQPNLTRRESVMTATVDDIDTFSPEVTCTKARAISVERGR